MTAHKVERKLSIVIPLYNEEENIGPFLDELRNVESRLTGYQLEVLFVNDGSVDASGERVKEMQKTDPRIRYIEFSRNFGKEAATSAGLHHATGDAVLLIDADLQHPIELIPEFVKKWEEETDVVIGVRKRSKSEGIIRRIGSAFFYRIVNLISETKIVPQSTDFRLLDRRVVDAFNGLSEHERMTRALIDWLGFRRDYIYFDAKKRTSGVPTYSLSHLVRLAVSGIITQSMLPLRLTGYLGVFIVFFSGVLGIVEFIDRFVYSWGFNFSGPAILATIILFLVGIVLMSIGLLAFYIEHIYRDSQSRPLYVVREIR
jgi:dolichol-phosphate mannosyltransferase